DGDFGDVGELGFQDYVVTGDNSLEITIPPDYITGAPVNARFRLYPTGGMPEPTGGVSDGEVEDYAWQFTPSAITLAVLTAGPSAPWGGLALLGVLVLGFVVWRRRRR
ncbi:MAG TPA: GEVED domain-containing protein, partial [Anaerolineae bacterium]|nr:GEVED domain-containing protein [Anaerolineae bacterium]